MNGYRRVMVFADTDRMKRGEVSRPPGFGFVFLLYGATGICAAVGGALRAWWLVGIAAVAFFLLMVLWQRHIQARWRAADDQGNTDLWNRLQWKREGSVGKVLAISSVAVLLAMVALLIVAVALQKA